MTIQVQYAFARRADQISIRLSPKACTGLVEAVSPRAAVRVLRKGFFERASQAGS